MRKSVLYVMVGSIVVLAVLVVVLLAGRQGESTGAAEEKMSRGETASRSDAQAVLGSIHTAEQVFYLRHQDVGYADLSTLKAGGLDIADAEKKWDVTVTPDGTRGYTASARHRTGEPIGVRFIYVQEQGGQWTDF